MKRKYILIFVVAVLVTGLLAGCKDEVDGTAAQDNIPIEAISPGEKEEVPPQAADLDAMAISQEIEDYTEVTETIPIDKDTRPEQSVTADGSCELTVNNPYFYDKEEIFLQAKAKYPDGYFNGDLVEKVAYIDVDMLQAYENGCVYKFTVDIDGDDFYVEEGWLNHYFYVTEDKIYIVPSSINIPYEKTIFPWSWQDQECVNHDWSHPLWNKELSSLISFVGNDNQGHLIMDMYSFLDGRWQRVRRLKTCYDEKESSDLDDPVYLGYYELIYSADGNVVEETAIDCESEAVWFDKDSCWSRYNENNFELSPGDGWDLVPSTIGGINIDKIVGDRSYIP